MVQFILRILGSLLRKDFENEEGQSLGAQVITDRKMSGSPNALSNSCLAGNEQPIAKAHSFRGVPRNSEATSSAPGSNGGECTRGVGSPTSFDSPTPPDGEQNDLSSPDSCSIGLNP